jgi:hypothetical protein
VGDSSSPSASTAGSRPQLEALATNASTVFNAEGQPFELRKLSQNMRVQSMADQARRKMDAGEVQGADAEALQRGIERARSFAAFLLALLGDDCLNPNLLLH